jgi:phospholipase A1
MRTTTSPHSVASPKWIIGALAFLSTFAIGFAGDAAWTLVSKQQGTAGQAVSLDVVAMNPGGRETEFDIKSQLEGVLSVGNLSWPVVLHGSRTSIAIPSGGFAARTFTFEIPKEAAGRGILEVKVSEALSLSTVIVIVVSRSDGISAPSPASSTPLGELRASSPAASAFLRNFAGRFLPNQPIYFVYGDAKEAAKFQFSFDYRLASMVLGSGENETAANVRFGYTQRSLWDIDGRSSPFYDTSYMPELVFNTEAPMPRDSDQLFTWLGFRTGFLHESNGKDGTDSRSLNIAYFRPRFVVGSLNGWDLVMLPEIHTYIGDVQDNRQIKDYRGYGKLRCYLGRFDFATVMFTGWTGKDFDHGTYQLDLTVPLKLHRIDLESFVYLQYFDGYGESLREYDRKSNALRIGFGLVR